MADDFAYMTALELRRLIRTKQVSPVAIVESTLRRVEALQPVLNPFVTVTADLALEAARQRRARDHGGRGRRPADRASAVDQGPDRGQGRALHLRLAHARRFRRARRRAGLRAREGARARRSSARPPRPSSAARRSSDSPLTGITRNPWNLEQDHRRLVARAPRASVAAGITPFALGTDGGGSIRIPSSFCGLFGIKAQFGRVPVFPAAATPTLAHVGTDGAHGARRGAAARRDLRLRCARSGERGRRCARLSRRLRASAEGPADRLEPDARLCPADCRGGRDRRQGRRARSRSWAARSSWSTRCSTIRSTLWMAEFYAGVGTRLKKPLAEQRDLIDPAVADGAADARSIRPSTTTTRACSQRYEFREKVRQFFERFDLLMTPTTPTPAFDIGARPADRARRRAHRRPGSPTPIRSTCAACRRPRYRAASRAPVCRSACTSSRRRCARPTSSAPPLPSRRRGRGRQDDRPSTEEQSQRGRSGRRHQTQPDAQGPASREVEVCDDWNCHFGRRLAAAVVAASLARWSHRRSRRSRSRSAIPAR